MTQSAQSETKGRRKSTRSSRTVQKGTVKGRDVASGVFRVKRAKRAERARGVWRKVGIARTGLKASKEIQVGYAYEKLDKISEYMGMDKKEVALVVGIASATLSRRKEKGSFNTAESDRIFRLSSIIDAAENLFEGDHEKALQWLDKPKQALGGHKPIDMSDTSINTQLVLDLIGRLEHGVAV